MERVIVRYQVLKQALATLEEPNKLLPTITDQKIYKMIRDSQIQRFEYCYEAFWQFLKDCLERSYGIETHSPSNIFRACYKLKLISKAEITKLLRMVRDRNQTSHAYLELAAESISQDIFHYYKIIQLIATRLFKEIDS
jgi:nucleotidyltransferase substrate binding protein (TIGR01987 family)